MANKVVLGAASLGVAGYYLSENLKDRRVQQEAEEQLRVLRERQEEDEERLRGAANGLEFREEKRKLEGYQDVTVLFRRRLHDKLMGLLETVKEQAMKAASENQSPMLPLISSPGSANEHSEVVLGAALALSDAKVIEHALLSLCAPSPGLALAKLSPKSLQLICRAFKTFCSCNSPCTYEELRPMMRFAAFEDKAQHAHPVVYPIEISTTETDELYGLARELNLFIIARSYFVGEWVGRTQTTARLRYTLQDRDAHLVLPRFGDKAFLMNFRGNFIVPAVAVGEMMQLDFENVRSLGKAKPMRPKNQELEVAALASFVASQAASNAAARLQELQLQSSGKGVSLEHITVECGYAGPFLQRLACRDMKMIETNSSRITSASTAKLEMCVPSPDASVESTENSVTDALREEISTFVKRYVQLLNLFFCEIPRRQGRSPSACVRKTGGVMYEALKVIFFNLPDPMALRTRRILEQEERERYICWSLVCVCFQRAPTCIARNNEIDFLFLFCLMTDWSVRANSVPQTKFIRRCSCVLYFLFASGCHAWGSGRFYQFLWHSAIVRSRHHHLFLVRG